MGSAVRMLRVYGEGRLELVPAAKQKRGLECAVLGGWELEFLHLSSVVQHDVELRGLCQLCRLVWFEG
jgi:hypothetical protein